MNLPLRCIALILHHECMLIKQIRANPPTWSNDYCSSCIAEATCPLAKPNAREEMQAARLLDYRYRRVRMTGPRG
jgi:hypothetical protein